MEDISILGNFRGYRTGLRYLQQQVFPPYFEMDLQERFKIAYNVIQQGWNNGPELLRMTVSSGRITNDVATYVDDFGNTLLHLINRGIAEGNIVRPLVGDFVDEEFNCRRPNAADSINRWRLLARETITAGAAVSAINENNSTVLQSLLISFGKRWPLNRNWAGCLSGWDALMALLNNWLIDLESCEIDLSSYGNEEWDHHFLYSAEYEMREGTAGPHPKLRLINFAYGRQPEDWTFWFSEPTDEFAGDFWRMIENVLTEDSYKELDDQILSTPGAWMEF